jgi:hypothetical protein
MNSDQKTLLVSLMILTTGLMLSLTAHGAETSKPNNPVSTTNIKDRAKTATITLESQITVISDETASVFGHELARQLSAKWMLYGEQLPTNLVLREKPSPLRGSLIEILLDGKLVFSRRYQTRRADIDQFSSDLITVINEKILARQIEAIATSPDLQGDGL